MPINRNNKICEYCGKPFFAYPYRQQEAKYCSRNCYHKATRKTYHVICKYCGREREVTPKEKDRQFCNLVCAHAYKREQPRTPTKNRQGYEMVWFTDGSGEKYHRFLMEQQLGRKLKSDEIVHHKDGDRSNNDLDNLEIMSWGEHSALHRRKEVAEGKPLFGREK